MRERVQVGPLRQAPSVRPTAAPTIRPVTVRAPQKGAGEGILKALSKIEPTLTRFMDQKFDETVAEEETRAYDQIQGMTFDEARAAVDSGDLASTESPWFDAAFRKQFGLRYAAERKRQISTAYQNDFDRVNGDIEEFLTGFVNEDASVYGGDDLVSAGIREGMSGFLEGIRDNHAKFRSETRQESASQGFLDVAREAALKAVSEGGDVSAAVRSLYGPHRDMLGVSFAQMDEMTLALAAEFAEEGNKDAVAQLLETEVTGADGQKVGSFLTRAKWATQAKRIRATSEARWTEAKRKDMIFVLSEHQTAASKGELGQEDFKFIQQMVEDEVITPGQAQSLVTQDSAAKERAAIAAENRAMEENFHSTGAGLVHAGNGWAITDQTYTDAGGTKRALKAGVIRQKAVDDAAAAMAEKGHSVASIAGTLASWGVPETYQPWENSLSSGYLSLSSALNSVDQKGDVQVPVPAMVAYDLFKQLGETPAFRARHVKDATALQTFMDAEVLERNGMDTEEALLLSAQVDRKRSRNGLTGRIGDDELTSAVSDAAGEGFFSSGAENQGYVSAEVESMARIFIDLGLPMNKALEEAGRRFSESHMVINGMAVNHRNRALPAQFEDMAMFAIDEYAAFQGEDPDDFSIRPAVRGERSWVIIDKATGLPPALGANANAFLTLSEITGRWKAKTEARADKLRADANTSVIEEKVGRNTSRNTHFDIR